MSGIIDVIIVKDGKEINVWILCRFDEFDENVLFIALFDYDAFHHHHHHHHHPHRHHHKFLEWSK